MSSDQSSNNNLSSLRRSAGFTLVEMLVVAPLAVLTIAVLVSAMIAMVGDAVLSQKSAASSYSMQDALDRIEADTRMSSTFLDSFKVLPAGQGRNATPSSMTDTTMFASKFVDAAKGDLILNAPATTLNPFDPQRQIVYYQNQPNACGATAYLNRSLSIKTIYFTLDDGKGTGTKNLWRRTILPDWNKDATPNSQTVCDTPWNRDTCPKILAPNCQSADEKMLENVTDFQVTYYTLANVVETSTSRNADSIKVNISVKDTLAGKTINQSGMIVSHRIAGSGGDIPSVPSIYVDRAEDNTMNNPRKASFTWQATAYGGLYTVRYSTNGGTSWSTPVETADNKLSISVWPGDSVKVGVIAKNDLGNSDESIFSYSAPWWTPLNLLNNWKCYDPATSLPPCPQVTMTKSGVVVYKGMAKDGSTGDTMFTIPAELTPSLSSQSMAFNALSGDHPGRINVNPDKSVVWDKVIPASNSTYVSLDNVIYPTTTLIPTASWTSPTLTTNGWMHAAAPLGNVRYAQDSQKRTWIQGVACNASSVAASAQVFTLPSGYQEHATLLGLHTNFAQDTFSSIFLTSGAAAQVQTNGKGATGTCPSGWMNFSFVYHSVNSTATLIAPTFASTWVNFAPATNITLGAHKGGANDNIVSLRGRVRDTALTTYTGNQKIATLPSGYRPKDLKVFNSSAQYTTPLGATTYGTARIEINPSGEIFLSNLSTYPPTGGWVSLEDIHFIADGS